MSSSSSRGGTNSREVSSGKLYSSLMSSLFQMPNKLVDWEAPTSTVTGVRTVLTYHGLSSVRLRSNECGLEGGTREFLFPCDGMISTKSIFRGKLQSENADANSLWRRRRTTKLTTQNKNRELSAWLLLKLPRRTKLIELQIPACHAVV